MNFYRVLYSNEFAKKNGEFGIVDVSNSINEYLLKDCKDFPFEEYCDLQLIFEGGNGKLLADNQMSYFPWRLISFKMYSVLKKYSEEEDIYYHPLKIPFEGIEYDYFLMHFKNKIEVLDFERMGNRGLLNPFIKVEKVKGKEIFIYEESDPSVFCVSESVRDELEQVGVSGCYFQLIS